MQRVFMDLETQSECDLRVYGGRHYARHPSTRILTAVFLLDDVYHVWLPGQDVKLPCFADLWPPGFPRRGVNVSETLPIDPRGCEFVAHNAMGFDALVWREKCEVQPLTWYDTIHAARAAGLPASLDKLGERFFGRGKDAGSAILHKLMKLPNKYTTPGNVAAVARYNVADVVILKRVYDETLGYGEPDVIVVHDVINSRGVGFDASLARTLVQLSGAVAEEAAGEMKRIAGIQNPRSVPEVKEWLASRGVPLKSLDRRVVDRLLTDPDSLIEELLEGEDDG